PEGQHPAIVDLLRHLDDGGYLEVVEAITKRERESGISYKQAVQDYGSVREMGRRKEEQGRVVAALEEQVPALEAETKRGVAKARDAKSERAWEEQRLQTMKENVSRRRHASGNRLTGPWRRQRYRSKR
ncbi:MAG: hypothetical protein ACUVXD_19435, partial [Thermodesulfobacteriota bacterium]